MNNSFRIIFCCKSRVNAPLWASVPPPTSPTPPLYLYVKPCNLFSITTNKGTPQNRLISIGITSTTKNLNKKQSSNKHIDSKLKRKIDMLTYQLNNTLVETVQQLYQKQTSQCLIYVKADKNIRYKPKDKQKNV